YDGDALGVVLLHGLQIRLLVVGSEGAVREQVECFDTPLPSPHLILGVGEGPAGVRVTPACPHAICGQGSRVLVLGASGNVYCCRLMAWQERLRTLQVREQRGLRGMLGSTRLALWFGFDFLRTQQAQRTAALALAMSQSHDLFQSDGHTSTTLGHTPSLPAVTRR
ncbi:hypothetical protein QJQ45_026817, partial [Haematococcus lacustris]